MTDPALYSAQGKVYFRLLPFLIVCYFVAYLDRVNVGFAALTMNADLGIGPEAYGFVAGIFFAGYALFEVPSNVILARVGARIWIARIMITWGLVSIATAFVTGVTSLSVARFLLGVAEAGFFPGIIYYLTRWIPASGRAGVISAFMAAVPVSAVIGAPVSGLILDALAGAGGLKGWQWLFILEAIPAIVLGAAAYFVLTDKPEDAAWLTPAESAALSGAIAAEDRAKVQTRAFTVREALTDRRVLALSLVYFGLATGLYSLTFWVPQIVKAFGLSNTQTGFVSAIPFLVGTLAMVVWGRHSDRTGERVWHISMAALLGGIGLIAGSLVSEPVPALAALSVAAIGVFCALPTFWTLPAQHLTGTAAAGGIALINALANIGGFVGPYLIGWLKGAGFTTGTAVASIASVMLLSSVLVVMLGDEKSAPGQSSRR